MKSFLLIFIINAYSSILFSQDEIQFTTEIIGNTYTENDFQRNNVVVIKKKKLLTREEKKLLFNSIKGLNEKVEDWDELEQDLLIVRTRSREIGDLISLYSKLSKNQLLELKIQLEKM